MEWPVLGPQVIGRVTSHPESFLVSHDYLSVWIVDPDSLGREDESAYDSTRGACNSGTAHGLEKTLQHSTLVPLAIYKKCENARLCRTFPRRAPSGLPPRNRSCFYRPVGKRVISGLEHSDCCLSSKQRSNAAVRYKCCTGFVK